MYAVYVDFCTYIAVEHSLLLVLPPNKGLGLTLIQSVIMMELLLSA